MAYIGISQWCKDNGVTVKRTPLGAIDLDKSPELQQVLETAICDGMCPVLCDECSEVEPDGHCQHKCPSLLLALGLI